MEHTAIKAPLKRFSKSNTSDLNMLTVVVACVAQPQRPSSTRTRRSRPPRRTAARACTPPRRCSSHGLDWPATRRDNATVAPIIRRHARRRLPPHETARRPRAEALSLVAAAREPAARRAAATAGARRRAGGVVAAGLRRRRGARRRRRQLRALRGVGERRGARRAALRRPPAWPSDESGGAPFGDADLLAVVDAICDPASVARALDLTRRGGAPLDEARARRRTL